MKNIMSLRTKGEIIPLCLFLLLVGISWAGWFFVPGAYWTFQDGTVGFLYTQGKYEKLDWSLDGRYAFSGDYWINTDLYAKVLGEGAELSFSFCSDSLEKDYRNPNIDTLTEYIPYELTEYSIYLRQHFNAGRSNKFYLYAGYRSGEYVSPYSYDMLNSVYNNEEETRIADAVDVGFEFSMDSREDPENPHSAFYFGMRLGALYFPSAKENNFDYLDVNQLSDPEKWPPTVSGYIELDQRVYGKLQIEQIPFPLIMALRIGGGHHITEVPQLVAFKAGTDDYLRGIDKRHIMGTSYYIMSGELRAQIWEESYTPFIILHWLIPGYENPRPILEIVPIVEVSKIYGEYVRDDKQQFTMGVGLHWVFTDFTVMRFDICNWPRGDTWGAYFSFEPSI